MDFQIGVMGGENHNSHLGQHYFKIATQVVEYEFCYFFKTCLTLNSRFKHVLVTMILRFIIFTFLQNVQSY